MHALLARQWTHGRQCSDPSCSGRRCGQCGTRSNTSCSSWQGSGCSCWGNWTCNDNCQTRRPALAEGAGAAAARIWPPKALQSGVVSAVEPQATNMAFSLDRGERTPPVGGGGRGRAIEDADVRGAGSVTDQPQHPQDKQHEEGASTQMFEIYCEARTSQHRRCGYSCVANMHGYYRHIPEYESSSCSIQRAAAVNYLVYQRSKAMANSGAGATWQFAVIGAAGCADERQLATTKQPWAAQLQQAMQAASVDFSLDSGDQPQPEAVRRAALRQYQQRLAPVLKAVHCCSALWWLFSSLVDAVLSYGSEVWGMQLAAASAAGKTSSTAGSTAERLHLAHLRRLLGVRQGTPTAVVLAEAGERPLWQRWLLRAVKLWNLAVTAEHSSLLWQAMTASVSLAVVPGNRIPARQPWAQQLAAALAAMGLQLDRKAAVQSACSAWQLKHLQDAATREGASKLQHYTQGVCGGTLDAASLGTCAAYLTVVRERSRRAPLAQLCTGSHWGAEETGRWGKIPPEQRLCNHCGAHDFDCPLYASLRTRFSDLFCLLPESRTLHVIFQQPPARLANFAASLKLQWQVAHAVP
ncbi:hypothetical protein ACK3TF_004665 [Chlorella vulgaris]